MSEVRETVARPHLSVDVLPSMNMDPMTVYQPTRREMVRMAAAALLFGGIELFPAAAKPLQLENHFSPLNKKRPLRPQTKYIVLHTTEGEEEGSLRKITRYGEAHYVVSYSGTVYRIIDKSKIAKHAGRSMWEGRSAIDNYSIGIEVVGYHNKHIRDAQYEALRELLRQLKSLYRIPDQDVLTHSMVAYGRPNRFHDNNHRGRKRCGMIFADPEVRARLGLQSKPDHDADVDAGRLKVADAALYHYLFAGKPQATLVASAGKPVAPAPSVVEPPAEPSKIDGNWTAWSIAREQYDQPSTVYVFPDGRRITGDKIEDWSKIPTGTQVVLNEAEDDQPFEGFLEIGKDGNTAQEVAGSAYASATTIYFFPDGLIRTGADLKKRRSTRSLLGKAPKGTRVLVGYIYGGHVKTRRPPSSIAGKKWNYPSTYYRYSDGRILNGDDIDINSIPAGTLIFYQQ
jgi:N-acetylmuramoyl-L-alanine amidase